MEKRKGNHMQRIIIMWLLVIGALLVALSSVNALTVATFSLWQVGIAVLFAVLARMVQAGKQHAEVMRRMPTATPPESPP
jgi:hypothetical protein